MYNLKTVKVTICLTLGILVAAQPATAHEFGVAAGLRQSSSEVSGANVAPNTGLQAGALANIQMSEAFWLRLGFLYTQRNFSAKFTGYTNEYKFTSMDMPINLLFKFSDRGGLFFGPVISMNQSKSCDTTSATVCAINEMPTPSLPLAFGVSFKFAPQLGADLIYELGPKKFATGIDNLQSIGANLVFYLD